MQQSIQVVAISDTHASMRQLRQILNYKADIFIHAGDFTYYGKDNHFLRFFQYLEQIPFKHKIVIGGNHQIMLDNGTMDRTLKRQFLQKYPCSLTRDAIRAQLRKRCIYLQHQAIVLEGLKIFGSPYTPSYGGSAFQYDKEYQEAIWDQIPCDLDILATHGPPFGILDTNSEGAQGGSAVLKEFVFKRKPKFHLFGHIHQGAGAIKMQTTTFINVANTPTRIVFSNNQRQNNPSQRQQQIQQNAITRPKVQYQRYKG